MPKTDRRLFLARTTAATAVLGFPFVGRAAPAPGADTAAEDSAPANRPAVDYADLFTTARERMQAQHKPGVVIVLPPDADDAAALKLALTATLLLKPRHQRPAVGDRQAFRAGRVRRPAVA